MTECLNYAKEIATEENCYKMLLTRNGKTISLDILRKNA